LKRGTASKLALKDFLRCSSRWKFAENLRTYRKASIASNMHVDMAARHWELGRQPEPRASSSTNIRIDSLFATDATPHGDEYLSSVQRQLYESISFLETEDDILTMLRRKFRAGSLENLRDQPARRRSKQGLLRDAASFADLNCGLTSIFCSPGAGQSRRLPSARMAGNTNSAHLRRGDADPNPPFDQYTSNRSTIRIPCRDNPRIAASITTGGRFIWRRVPEVLCSPDVGGHLYTCIDKISGQSMFYANPSFKKANIGTAAPGRRSH